MSKPFYITATIFYPNANLHIGNAYTVTICDILSRSKRLQGEDVYFVTGSDENTGKIIKTIAENNQTVESYLDSVAGKFKELYKSLDISYDQYVQTSNKDKHWPAAIALWKKLVDSGDIYKSKYTGLYCVGCETFYTEKDLVDGKCPIHLTVPEKIEEENYFFKLSKYTDVIKQKIESDELVVVPNTRKNEILALLGRGLEDVSFSRPIKNVPHGIPVPEDPEQVIYVWCDALVSYISGLGYGQSNQEIFEKFWPADVHVIGKDILRFHTAIWPAMLLSADLPLPKSVLAHGLITSGGHKMSKSLGNVVDPFELISEYGKDAVRYYFAREISLFEDGDFTLDKFKEVYNANLANGLGNLVSRVMKMAESYDISAREADLKKFDESFPYLDQLQYLNDYQIGKAMDSIWSTISTTDTLIQTDQAFKLIKTNRSDAEVCIKTYLLYLIEISIKLRPFMPETSKKIEDLIKLNKSPEAPLFLRKD